MKSDGSVTELPIILPSRFFPLQLDETTLFTDCVGGLMTLLLLRICDGETAPVANREDDSPLEFL
jgi:hypothetical protein